VHNVELLELYSSPHIISMIKWRGLKWVGHVACMGKIQMHTKIWSVNLKWGDRFEDIDIDGRIIMDISLKSLGGWNGLRCISQDWKLVLPCRIWGYHGNVRKDCLSCCTVQSFGFVFSPEHGGIMFLRNVGIHPRDYMAQQPRIQLTVVFSLPLHFIDLSFFLKPSFIFSAVCTEWYVKRMSWCHKSLFTK
jgi:hypothetical protein